MNVRANPTHERLSRPDVEKRAVPDLSVLPDIVLLTRADVAAVSRYSVQTLKKWAREGRGPSLRYVEGRPRYRVRDVRKWIEHL